MLKAFCYAGFDENSKVIGRKLHYPKSVCIVLILYKESIKRAVFNTQYTVRPQSVYRVPYRTGQKNDLIQDAFIRNYDILTKKYPNAGRSTAASRSNPGSTRVFSLLSGELTTF